MYLSQGRLGDRGQTTIALAGVLAMACLLGLAVGLVGQALTHRAHARNAADAVALAAVTDPDAAAGLSQWYGAQGIQIEIDGDQTIARSGPSQAGAWAELRRPDNHGAPVFVAILARAEQLTGVTFGPVRWHEASIELSANDAASLASVAGEFGLCLASDRERVDDWETFELC